MKIWVSPAKEAYGIPSASSDWNLSPLAYWRACSLYPIPSKKNEVAKTEHEYCSMMSAKQITMQLKLIERGLRPLAVFDVIRLDLD